MHGSAATRFCSPSSPRSALIYDQPRPSSNRWRSTCAPLSIRRRGPMMSLIGPKRFANTDVKFVRLGTVRGVAALKARFSRVQAGSSVDQRADGTSAMRSVDRPGLTGSGFAARMTSFFRMPVSFLGSCGPLSWGDAVFAWLVLSLGADGASSCVMSLDTLVERWRNSDQRAHGESPSLLSLAFFLCRLLRWPSRSRRVPALRTCPRR